MFLSREIEKIKKSRKAIHEQRDGVNDQLKVLKDYNKNSMKIKYSH